MRSSNLSAYPYPGNAVKQLTFMGTKKHPLPNPLPNPLLQVGGGINTGKQEREIIWHTPKKHLCTQ
jgi:hypothetical protein